MKLLFYIQKPAVFEYKKVNFPIFRIDPNSLQTIDKAFFMQYYFDIKLFNHGASDVVTLLLRNPLFYIQKTCGFLYIKK